MKAGLFPALRRPSLVRRVVIALLMAFALVGTVLVAVDFMAFRRATQSQEGLHQAVRALAASLDFADEARAVHVMQATETQYNLLRRATVPLRLGDVLLVLDRIDGTRMYASPGLGTDSYAAQDADPPTRTVNGQTYWSATIATPRWRVYMLEPALSDADALGLIAGNLVQSLLIAFPLVLLPLWLAVRRGLLPLRTLVQRVTGRAPADFSPLRQDLRYAELQPLESAFNALLRQARNGIQSERGFVQDAAHELRTPLAVIAAQAHALAAATEPRQRQSAREELERAIERASHLVHQLLTLARLEARSPAVQQTVDLVDLVQGVLVRLQPAALAGQIDLGLESPESLPVTVDVQVFLSALENLVRNALAYVHPGARVTVSVMQLGTETLMCVADDGPGIKAEERPRLLERFQRGQNVQSSGSGLGLAIVAQAAAQLGGALQLVDGIEGQGIGFLVRWPTQTTD